MEMECSSLPNHHQEMGSTLESMLVCTKQQQQEKKPRPAEQGIINCPRCDSTNTKFCYYNNYSLSQPRYFCKSCRRYWTKGGTLRNVPVGGGCRKNKRSSSSSSSTSSSKRNQDHQITTLPSPMPCLNHLSYDSNDLNLAIARLQKQTNGQLGYDNFDFSMLGNQNMVHNESLGNSGENTPTEYNMESAMVHNESLGNSGVNTPTGYNVESANGFHNLYYGNESGRMGLNVFSQGMGLGFEELGDVTMSSNVVKQEMCSNGREGESGRVLWGFPWHGVGSDGNHIGEADASRLSWNAMGSSNWHGLLNSSLV